MSQQISNELKQVLLYMLDSIDRICRENGIHYFLDSGTALGAVRHNGFIPWDDDIDIGMLREDYDQFLLIAPQCLPDDLVLQNEKSEPSFYLFHSKLRKDNTLYTNSRREKNFKYKGFQIDIFPFDYIGDDLLKAKHYFKYVERNRIISEARMQVVPPVKKYKRILYYILKLLPSCCFSRERIEKLMRKNNDTPKLYVASYGYMLAKKKYCIFPSDTMEPGGDILFEEKPYMIMKDPDGYLKTMYGDYMKLPPMEERVPAHGHGIISFDVKAEH